jgi:hypothetical protein
VDSERAAEAASSSAHHAHMAEIHGDMIENARATNIALTDCFWGKNGIFTRQLKKPCCYQHRPLWIIIFLCAFGCAILAAVVSKSGGDSSIGFVCGFVGGAIIGKLLEHFCSCMRYKNPDEQNTDAFEYQQQTDSAGPSHVSIPVAQPVAQQSPSSQSGGQWAPQI